MLAQERTAQLNTYINNGGTILHDGWEVKSFEPVDNPDMMHVTYKLSWCPKDVVIKLMGYIRILR